MLIPALAVVSIPDVDLAPVVLSKYWKSAFAASSMVRKMRKVPGLAEAWLKAPFVAS